MSEPSGPRGGDAGLSFVEVIVAVLMLGMLATVLSGATVMTLRGAGSSKGRANVARAEQNVALYLPNDLASATEVLACGGECALHLRWTLDTTVTNVRYRLVGETVEREICVGTDCTTIVVVREGVTGLTLTDAACRRVLAGLDGRGRAANGGGGVNAVEIEAAVVARGELDPDSTLNAPTLANLEALQGAAPAGACT